jgi:hypothetical protein
MNVEIVIVAAKFLFWEYFIRIFFVGSLQCSWNYVKFPFCPLKTTNNLFLGGDTIIIQQNVGRNTEYKTKKKRFEFLA